MIGERLAKVRKAHGDTQETLSEKLGVSLPTVRTWEQNKCSPNDDILVEICKMYGVSSDYLLGIINQDSSYAEKIRETKFTDAELEAIRDYERYILSKRKNHNT